MWHFTILSAVMVWGGSGGLITGLIVRELWIGSCRREHDERQIAFKRIPGVSEES
jgi:hypothetical protein